MIKITIWYCIGGGSNPTGIKWFLSEQECEKQEGLGECDNYGSVETFEGSDIYKQAIKNS